MFTPAGQAPAQGKMRCQPRAVRIVFSRMAPVGQTSTQLPQKRQPAATRLAPSLGTATR
jgi:hypothetical protein